MHVRLNQLQQLSATQSDLRHAYVRWLLQNGASLKAVSELLVFLRRAVDRVASGNFWKTTRLCR